MTVVYASYSLRMEGEAVKESVVCGNHIHKEVWRPVNGQEHSVLPEPNNHHERQAVAIYMDGVIVGHVPREISKILCLW